MADIYWNQWSMWFTKIEITYNCPVLVKEQVKAQNQLRAKFNSVGTNLDTQFCEEEWQYLLGKSQCQTRVQYVEFTKGI